MNGNAVSDVFYLGLRRTDGDLDRIHRDEQCIVDTDSSLVHVHEQELGIDAPHDAPIANAVSDTPYACV